MMLAFHKCYPHIIISLIMVNKLINLETTVLCQIYRNWTYNHNIYMDVNKKIVLKKYF
jgi:hypothetical protein